LILPATTLALSMTFALSDANAQTSRQLSLADILIALRSNKATMPEKNKILSDAVGERGITFALTTEIETELSKTGADKTLVDAIRQKSPIVKAAIKTEPEKPQPKSSPKPVDALPDFTFYQKRADENIGKGEYDLAIVDYNKAVELNPKSVPAYFNRARAFYFKRDFAEAIESYSKVIELTPKDSVVFYNRGVAYEKMGDALKAAEDYEKALALDENNSPAKENLKKIRDAELAKKPVQPAPKQTEAVQTKQSNQPENTSNVFNYGRIDPSLATRMVTPVYSAMAKSVRAEGQVTVEVELDEEGNVTSAKAVAGHAMLRNSAEEAAKRSKFKPAMIAGKPAKATGQIFYNFKN
jgi:TonB family protein